MGGFFPDTSVRVKDALFSPTEVSHPVLVHDIDRQPLYHWKDGWFGPGDETSSSNQWVVIESGSLK